MIHISGATANYESIVSQYTPMSIERDILEILFTSSKTYSYKSINTLNFELKLRKNIITASRELYSSRFSFKTFRNSTCNTEFWERTAEGGFLLKDSIKPYNAINDIFRNGRLYGTECATAIVIVFYKAVLNVFSEQLFNQLFNAIYLMDWQRLDNSLGINSHDNLTDYLPGDCRYFKNPDVDPLTPEWQGENAIDLGDGTYYGHGIGIRNANEMINILNRHRENGSETSAYLLNSATRPNFEYLALISTT